MTWGSHWYRLREDPRAHRLEPLGGAGGTRRSRDRDPPIVIAALVLGIGIPALALLALAAGLLAESPAWVRVAAGAAVLAAGAAVVLRVRSSRRRAAERREARWSARDARSDR